MWVGVRLSHLNTAQRINAVIQWILYVYTRPGPSCIYSYSLCAILDYLGYKWGDVWHLRLTVKVSELRWCKTDFCCVFLQYFCIVGSLSDILQHHHMIFPVEYFLKMTLLMFFFFSSLAMMEVYVPDQPVVVLHGRDATLNCSFSPTSPFNLSDLSVFWQLTDTKRSVHGYWEGQDQLADQAERFASRTSLFPAQLGLGNTSLLLRRVVVADEGSYTCFVRVQDYGSAALLLQVAGESSCDVHVTCRNKQMNTGKDTYDDQWQAENRSIDTYRELCQGQNSR